MSNTSPRQELGDFAESGDLRGVLERGASVSSAAIDLAVEVIRRYCEPRRRPTRPEPERREP